MLTTWEQAVLLLFLMDVELTQGLEVLRCKIFDQVLKGLRKCILQ